MFFEYHARLEVTRINHLTCELRDVQTDEVSNRRKTSNVVNLQTFTSDDERCIQKNPRRDTKWDQDKITRRDQAVWLQTPLRTSLYLISATYHNLYFAILWISCKYTGSFQIIGSNWTKFWLNSFYSFFLFNWSN